jgi:hypothetical protein
VPRSAGGHLLLRTLETLGGSSTASIPREVLVHQPLCRECQGPRKTESVAGGWSGWAGRGRVTAALWMPMRWVVAMLPLPPFPVAHLAGKGLTA